MSDLASLMQVAPMSAAFMVGQNNSQSQASEALRQQQLREMIQELQTKNQQAQTMNPELVRHQQLANQGLEAGLPGIQADSRKKGLDADLKAGTLQTDIAAGNSTNETTISSNQAKQLKSFGELLNGAAVTLKDTPAALGQRPLQFKSYLESRGIRGSAADALVQQFGNMEPAKMKEAAEAILKHSEPYLQHIDQATITAKSHEKTTAMNNSTQLALEKMRIEAGKYDRASHVKSVEDRLRAAPNAAAKAEVLESAYYEARAKDPELANVYLARAQEARKRAAEDADNKKIAPNGVSAGAVTGLPTNPPAAATAPIGGAEGGSPSPAPASMLSPAGAAQVAPPGIKSLADLKRAYPGKSDDELRAAYKRKFGVDLK